MTGVEGAGNVSGQLVSDRNPDRFFGDSLTSRDLQDSWWRGHIRWRIGRGDVSDHDDDALRLLRLALDALDAREAEIEAWYQRAPIDCGHDG